MAPHMIGYMYEEWCIKLQDYEWLRKFVRFCLTESYRADAAVQIGCSNIKAKKFSSLCRENMEGICHLGNKREGCFLFDCR